MVGLSRRRVCWGCAGMVVVSTLAAYLRTEAPSQTPAIPTVAVDDVEPLDSTAAGAVVAAAADAVDAVGATLMRALYLLARDDVLGILGKEVESCINWRRTPNQSCTEASQCGKGWLFRREGLLFAVLIAPDSRGIAAVGGDAENMGEAAGGRDAAHEWYAGETRMVNVVGMSEGHGGELADCNSKDLSMLLRLQGPEALAEAAIPVPGRCAWTAQFRPELEGVYDLDVTLLDWRGNLEPHQSQCNEVVGQFGEGAVEMGSVSAVPFYGTFEGCCALCTRKEGCVAWSATDAPNKALVDGKRCVLYSAVAGKPVEDKSLEQTIRSGTPREEDHMMYLGPSMSIARRWCSQENGNVYVGIGGQVTVTPAPTEPQGDPQEGAGEPQQEGAASTATSTSKAGEATLPLCSDTTSLPRDGRWVRRRDTECDFTTEMMDSTWWPIYNKDVFGAAMPEECFLRPVRVGQNAELKTAEGGYVWQPYDCRYDLMSSEDRLSCFRDKNVTRFLDFGDSLISTSRMPRSALWLPTAERSAWSSGKGAREVGKGAEEAGCAGGPIQYYGEANHQHQPAKTGATAPTTFTSRYCGVEAYWQLKPGQLRNLVSSFKPDVVLANWAIVHRLWHHTFEEFEVFLGQLARQLDGMAQQDAHIPRHMFWLSTPFLVSEREPHCVMERGLQFTEALRGMLEPRGWIEIDWVSMTRKWGFDIVDGVHHGQPPTRMLAYLLMHHVCHATESKR